MELQLVSAAKPRVLPLLAFFIYFLGLTPASFGQELGIQLPLPTMEPTSEFKPAIKFETVSLANKDQIVHQENRWGFNARFGDRNIKFLGASVDKIAGQAPWILFSGYRAMGTLDW